MRPSLLLSAIVLAAGSASAAQACRVMMAPEQKVAGGYEYGVISAVALVEIEQAEHISEPVFLKDKSQLYAHPWRATARLIAPLRGDGPFPETMEFERGYGSPACEWTVPALPATGDRWVVYFFTGIEGRLMPWQSFPQAEATRIDPKLSPQTR